jgi:predicted nucleic acid-binding protein
VVDASPLIAAFDTADPEHAACRQALHAVGHAVVSPVVLAEVDYRLTTGISPQAALVALRYIADKVAAGRFEVPDVGGHLHAAHTVAETYIDFPLGLADAMNVVLARAFRTDVIVTLDRKHFRAITPLTGHRGFRLLPDDL